MSSRTSKRSRTATPPLTQPSPVPSSELESDDASSSSSGGESPRITTFTSIRSKEKLASLARHSKLVSSFLKHLRAMQDVRDRILDLHPGCDREGGPGDSESDDDDDDDDDDDEDDDEDSEHRDRHDDDDGDDDEDKGKTDEDKGKNDKQSESEWRCFRHKHRVDARAIHQAIEALTDALAQSDSDLYCLSVQFG